MTKKHFEQAAHQESEDDVHADLTDRLIDDAQIRVRKS